MGEKKDSKANKQTFQQYIQKYIKMKDVKVKTVDCKVGMLIDITDKILECTKAEIEEHYSKLSEEGHPGLSGNVF